LKDFENLFALKRQAAERQSAKKWAGKKWAGPQSASRRWSNGLKAERREPSGETREIADIPPLT
jgi:hypothetical protein